jgi:hypothetical protein
MDLEMVTVDNPENLNLIFGQSHFIKTIEDLYEALIQCSMSIKFGVAFCEASGDRLVRWDGNDNSLIELAKNNAVKIGCGHTFIVFMKDAFPVNCLNAIKNVPEVARIFCATANPLQVIVAKSSQGRGVMGVIDGQSPLGVEDQEKQQERKTFLRKIGYKR